MRVQQRLNGEVLQDARTSSLMFDIPELTAYVSSVLTLEPGDLILTGTPAGVGFGCTVHTFWPGASPDAPGRGINQQGVTEPPRLRPRVVGSAPPSPAAVPPVVRRRPR